MADSDQGKCKACGFLAKRSRSGFGHPPATDYEATKMERTSPEHFFTRWDHNGRHSTVDFACFRGIIDLAAEYRGKNDETERTNAVKLALDRDRKCSGWYPYNPGFSPMNHFDWYQEERKEGERREFEERLSLRQEEFQAKLAEQDQRLQNQRDLAAATSDRVMKRFTLAALILALAQVLTLTKDSLLVKAAIWLWRRLFG